MARKTPADRSAEEVIKLSMGAAPAEVRAASFNEEERTIEVVWSTGADVKRRTWDDGEFIERLSMDPKHVRLDRLNAGAPLLDTHDSYELRSVIGSVVPGTAKVSGGKGTAVVKLSAREQVAGIVQDIKDGIIRNISVGYRILKAERSEGDGKSLPILRAIDWEPMEISAVPIPADPGAQVRSESGDKRELHECLVTRLEDEIANAASSAETLELPMNKREAAKNLKARELDIFAMGFGLTRNDGEADEAFSARLLAKFDADDAAATRTAAPVQTQQQAPVLDDAAVRAASEAATRAETDRVTAIISLGTKHRLDPAFVQEHIGKRTTVADFRTAVLDKLASGQEQTEVRSYGELTVTVAEEQTRREAVINALMHRIDSSVKLESGRDWRGMSMLEIGRELLRLRGVKVAGMTRMELASKMFERSGAHTTSDFPIILEQITNRTLRAAYDVYPQTFKPFCKKVTAVDFKDMHRVQVGEVGDLSKVNENGEYTYTSFGEGKEKYRIATYGKIIAVTRQVIVNDDMGVFTNLSQKFGNAVARLESKTVWDILITNAKIYSDNTALFHANHNNLAGANAAITAASLALARSAMGKQKDIDSRDYLDIKAKYLLHAPEKALEVQQLLGSFMPNVPGNVVPDFVRTLTPIEEVRMSALNNGLSWILVGDPNQIDTIEYAYLEGQEGPYTETEQGFDVDGMRIKVRQDFGAAPIDYRGFYKNVGA